MKNNKYYVDPATKMVYGYPLDGSLDSLIPTTQVPVAEADVDQAIAQHPVPAEIAALIASKTYADKRRAEYPPIENYMDGLVKGDQAQMDAYIAACQAVKTKYPKPI
jgi:hypothetical protein